jgi:hypothetical protein
MESADAPDGGSLPLSGIPSFGGGVCSIIILGQCFAGTAVDRVKTGGSKPLCQPMA